MRIIRFWKPYNVVTKFSRDSSQPDQQTLSDFIDAPGVYAAGRLDNDSEGLLLLTDSGALNTRLTDPVYAHPRTYLAQVERVPTDEALQQLRDGLDLNDGRTRPALVDLLDAEPDLPQRPVPIRFRKNIPTAWIRVTLTEGRNRQVRRMTAAVGYPTLRLVRWSIGPITLQGLEPGQWETLSKTAQDALWDSVNGNKPR